MSKIYNFLNSDLFDLDCISKKASDKEIIIGNGISQTL